MAKPTTDQVLWRFFRMLHEDKVGIRNIYILAVVIGLINLSLPLGIQSIINLIQVGTVSTSFFVLVLVVTLGVALAGVMNVGQLKILERIERRLFVRASFEFGFRVPRLHFNQLFENYAPELMNRFFDIIAIQKSLSKVLLDIGTALVQVIFGLILLSLYHPFFVLFSIFLVVGMYLLLKFTFDRGMSSSLVESKLKYKVAGWLQEMGRVNLVFKLFGKTSHGLQKVDRLSEDYLVARGKHFEVLMMQYWSMIALKIMVTIGLLLIGGILVLNQQINIGQFVAAEIVILLIINSVEKLILSFETVYDVLTSVEKVGQITDLPLELEGNTIELGEDDNIHISFDQVDFQFPGINKLVLNSFSAEIAQGNLVFILSNDSRVGNAFFYLLTGFMEPKKGSVMINHFPIQNLSLNGYREKVSGCFATDDFFDGTLYENIVMSRANLSTHEVAEVLEVLKLDDTIRQLKEGTKTMLHAQDLRFSSKEKIKILIARALLSKPKVLFLDSYFDVLPPEDREDLLKTIKDYIPNSTLIVAGNDPHHFNGFFNQIIECNNNLC